MGRCSVLIVLTVVALALAACTTSTPSSTNSRQWGGGTGIQLTEGVELALEAQPRPGWTLAKVTGWPTQRGFSLRLPAGWEINELQSVDPYAAEVIGDGVRLALQYGELSRDLNPADDPVHDYTVLYHEVGGVNAKLLVSTDVSGGFAGISFPRFDGSSLIAYGHDLTREQLPIAIGILKSIRILEE